MTLILQDFSEIYRRGPNNTNTCGSKGGGTYNTPLHVLALVVVLVISTLACGFPLVVKRFPQLKVPRNFLFLARHFGTGVLLATAFVHLLPTAFVSLTDPCLPDFWTKTYPAMAGAIALAAVFLVVTIEMIFASFGAPTHTHGGFDAIESEPPMSPAQRRSAEESPFLINGSSNGATDPVIKKHRRSRSGSISTALNHIDKIDRLERQSQGVAASDTELQSFIPDSSPVLSDSDDDSDAGVGESTNLTRPEISPHQSRQQQQHHHHHHQHRSRRRSSHEHRDASMDGLTDLQQQKKALLQVALLEAGILFHSVFIGMALSVATGSNFVVLFIAIVFHQTFEGLALGARISAITLFERNSPRPWLMCLAYGATTPIGQAIGLATHTLYDPASMTGLLMVGIMNAVSSGLLLFAGLVELLAEDFLSDESVRTLRGRKRVTACLAVFAGSFGMAFIGAFA